MNKNIAIVMGGALVMAILVAMVVSSKLAPKPTQAKAGVEILVANKKLFIGETLKAENVHWQEWPESGLFAGVIRRKEQADENKLEVYGTPLRRDIESGEPITTQAVLADSKGATSFLTASISAGMRAMAVNVSAQSSAGGFVSPGDYVDVIFTYSAKPTGGFQQYTVDMFQEFASQTLLRNVKVLAVDQKAKAGEAAEIKVGKTVTLEVDQKGAEKLALASTMGTLSLSLRRLGDKDPDNIDNLSLTTDATTSEVLKRATKRMTQSQFSSDIRVYSGTSVENVAVQRAAPADGAAEAKTE